MILGTSPRKTQSTHMRCLRTQIRYVRSKVSSLNSRRKYSGSQGWGAIRESGHTCSTQLGLRTSLWSDRPWWSYVRTIYGIPSASEDICYSIASLPYKIQLILELVFLILHTIFRKNYWQIYISSYILYNIYTNIPHVSWTLCREMTSHS